MFPGLDAITCTVILYLIVEVFKSLQVVTLPAFKTQKNNTWFKLVSYTPFIANLFYSQREIFS